MNNEKSLFQELYLFPRYFFKQQKSGSPLDAVQWHDVRAQRRAIVAWSVRENVRVERILAALLAENHLEEMRWHGYVVDAYHLILDIGFVVGLLPRLEKTKPKLNVKALKSRECDQ